jgi:3-oxoacyl-[acyl-carrier-protein] synthase III
MGTQGDGPFVFSKTFRIMKQTCDQVFHKADMNSRSAIVSFVCHHPNGSRSRRSFQLKAKNPRTGTNQL